MAASETQCAHPIGPIAHILTYRTTTSVAGILPLLPPREEREEGRPAYDCIWSKECCAPLPSPTAVELATSRPRIFSLSPRGTSGERAGERGNLLLTPNANCKQDGPPLPSPLLPRREEREAILLLSLRSLRTDGVPPQNAKTGVPPARAQPSRPLSPQRGEGWGALPLN